MNNIKSDDELRAMLDEALAAKAFYRDALRQRNQEYQDRALLAFRRKSEELMTALEYLHY